MENSARGPACQLVVYIRPCAQRGVVYKCYYHLVEKYLTRDKLGTPALHLGLGSSLIPNIFAGIDVNKIALVYAVVSIAKFVNNPLFQRAIQIVAQNIVTNHTMMLDVKQRLPDGWTALLGDDTLNSMIGLPNDLSTYQA